MTTATYDQGQIIKLASYLIAADDCLHRAMDGLEPDEPFQVSLPFVEKQVARADTAVRRALNILREIQWVDVLIGSHNLAARVIGGETISSE